jgi:hypothetical protein
MIGGSLLQSNRLIRFFIAFLLAPISFGILLMLPGIFFGFGSKPGMSLYVLMFVAYVGYPIALVIGLPLFALFRYLRWNGFLTYAISSFGFSVLLNALFVVGPAQMQGEPLQDLLSATRLAQMGLLTFACTLTVLSFWLIARPDRD